MCPVAYRSRRWITFSGTVDCVENVGVRVAP